MEDLVKNKGTREPQYNAQIEMKEKKGLASLGLSTNLDWRRDPKRVLFLLARYKFVSKMLAGKSNVLEIGCGDAFGTRIVLDEVGAIDAIDFDPIFVQDINSRMEKDWEFTCITHDMLSSKMNKRYDAAYAIDVFEHIAQEDEQIFLNNVISSLTREGVLILGMPSLQSQKYASEGSKIGHVNCKDEPELRKLLTKNFQHVFLFSMNDEVVHTGFYMMAHYYFALCVSPKIIT
ncbi:MAG: hypothetical protein ACD_44C00469G0008 [uncultured bacterium]|nr:MAG: hypothetical protein ACD_44C00469G0008 [uncultured bacterium]